MPEYAKKEKLTFRDIVLSHLNKILEITTREFKGGYTKTVMHGDWHEEVYIPDSRKEYIQSVEGWSDILKPHFTPKMKEKYKEIEEKLNIILSKYEKEEIEHEDYVLKKLKIVRELFQELNHLLYDKNYLKKAVVYG